VLANVRQKTNRDRQAATLDAEMGSGSSIATANRLVERLSVVVRARIAREFEHPRPER
jgi:hypothetical protein